MEIDGECNLDADELSAVANGVVWTLVRCVTQYNWVAFGNGGFSRRMDGSFFLDFANASEYEALQAELKFPN